MIPIKYKQLQDFFNGDINNTWLTIDSYMALYVRKGFHYNKDFDSVISTLDLANFETPEKYRSTGICTRFLNWLESRNVPIYVECIHNPRLLQFLLKRGYKLADDSSVPSVFKNVNGSFDWNNKPSL